MKFKASLIRYFFVVVLSSILASCATGRKSYVIEDNLGTQKIEINFPETDPISGDSISFDIESYDFSSSIANLSKYRLYREPRRGEITEGIQVRNSKKEGNPYSKAGNRYTISYVRASKIREGTLYPTSVVYILDYKITGNAVELSLLPDYTYYPAVSFYSENKRLLDSIPNLTADVKQIFSKLDTIPAYIRKSYQLKGEVNTHYPAEAIYENFERKSGGYKWKKDEATAATIKKENTFNLKHRGKNYPVSIDIYPHRNGSKVVYTASVSYSIDSKGKVTLSKSEIEQLHEAVKSVISD